MNITSILSIISQNVAPFAAGFVFAHLPWILGGAFSLALKIPFVRSAILSNPERSKEMIDSIAKELDQDIDSLKYTPSVPEVSTPSLPKP